MKDISYHPFPLKIKYFKFENSSIIIDYLTFASIKT